MFTNLNVFRLAHAMASHAGARQAVVARNMANADTPGYAAQDIAPFAETYQAPGQGMGLRATRPDHLNGTASDAFEVIDRRGAERDPNGNSVTLETEMLNAVAVKRQHDRALAIYKSSLSVLRTAIGRR